ncbi:MAG: uroporphyrinogen-III synthase [Halioglobus sp.]
MSSKHSVCITRPTGQAKALSAALAQAGVQVISQPLLVIEPLPQISQTVRSRVLALDEYQHIIFVSLNAVQFGMELITDYWPQLPQGLHWYSVGSATAAALHDFGVVAAFPPQNMSSEGLLQMDALQSVAGDRVLIVRGEGGRTTLRETLLARGARVDDLPCYRRSSPAYIPGSFLKAMDNASVGLLVVTSSEGLANLLALLSPEETTNLQVRALLVSSERVADQAREEGFRHVRVARNASDAAIVEAVLQWQKNMREL